jgi:signal peptidase I
LFEILQTLLLAAVLYFAIDAVIGRERVQKISMEPTFEAGEILMVNKLAYKFGEFEYGQVITFHYPLDPSLDYIKRIIGLPGDVVDVQNGEVRVNGQLLYEPYISARRNTKAPGTYLKGNCSCWGITATPRRIRTCGVLCPRKT